MSATKILNTDEIQRLPRHEAQRARAYVLRRLKAADCRSAERKRMGRFLVLLDQRLGKPLSARIAEAREALWPSDAATKERAREVSRAMRGGK